MSAFFACTGDGFTPLSMSRGYWKHDSLHGRAIVGLLGDELARRHGSPEHIPARLSVDMYRLAPFGFTRIESREIIRSGRLVLVQAELSVEGVPVALATCQFLRLGKTPPGQVWSPGPWNAPYPDDHPPAEPPGPGRIFEWHNVEGRLNVSGPRKMWMREYHDLIEDVALTPYARAALGADFASPYANAGDAGMHYINTDVVLQLHRLPIGEWIGFETTGHEASNGIAVGNCRLHDRGGAIGYVACTALFHEKRG